MDNSKIIACNRCGHKLPADSDFCQYCGEPIEKNVPSMTVPLVKKEESASVMNNAKNKKQSKKIWHDTKFIYPAFIVVVFLVTLLLGVFTFASETVEKTVYRDGNTPCYADKDYYHESEFCGAVNGKKLTKTTIGAARNKGCIVCSYCFGSSTIDITVQEINWGEALLVAFLVTSVSSTVFIILFELKRRKAGENSNNLDGEKNTTQLYSILQKDSELREMLFVILSLTPENKTLVKELLKKMK